MQTEQRISGAYTAQWNENNIYPLRIVDAVSDELGILFSRDEARGLRDFLNEVLTETPDLETIKKAIGLAAKLLLHIDDLFPIVRFVLQEEFTNVALAVADATIEVATDVDVSSVKEAADAVRAAL